MILRRYKVIVWPARTFSRRKSPNPAPGMPDFLTESNGNRRGRPYFGGWPWNGLKKHYNVHWIRITSWRTALSHSFHEGPANRTIQLQHAEELLNSKCNCKNPIALKSGLYCGYCNPEQSTFCQQQRTQVSIRQCRARRKGRTSERGLGGVQQKFRASQFKYT